MWVSYSHINDLFSQVYFVFSVVLAEESVPILKVEVGNNKSLTYIFIKITTHSC